MKRRIVKKLLKRYLKNSHLFKDGEFKRILSSDIYVSNRGWGTITGEIISINDPPRDEDLVETYGTFELVGKKVRLLDYPNPSYFC